MFIDSKKTKQFMVVSCGNGKIAFVSKRGSMIEGNYLEYEISHSGHTSSVISFDFRQDDETLISASEDNIVTIWNCFNSCEKKKIILP